MWKLKNAAPSQYRRFAVSVEPEMRVLGCKVNFADTESLLGRLAPGGASPVALVGTCCVTSEAEKQSRKEVRRAVRSVGPGGTVFVSGCAVRRTPGSFESLGDNVIVLDGVKSGLPQDGTAENYFRKPHGGSARPVAGRRTRAFIKVQDGCSNCCSYCVIPSVRGRPRSLPAHKAIEKASARMAAGYQELVVCGINVGAYRDGEITLAGLLGELAGIEGLGRLRLSSIEVTDIDQGLIAVMEEHADVIGRHLHIPLQSGDDGVLAAMGRRYDRQAYIAKVERLKSRLPDLNLTTDVIVGFPGEDESAFGNTVSLAGEIGFSKIHVFPYSPRYGTSGFALGDTVPPQVKKERSSRLRQLSSRMGKAHRQRKLGQTSEVLLESVGVSGISSGYSSDYTRFVVPAGSGNRVARVLGIDLAGDSVRGEVIADGAR